MKIDIADVEEYRFLVVKGANAGSKLSFKPAPRVIRIGRAVDNDIVISDPGVSRLHARVEIQADGATTIVDAGSSAGLEKMGFRIGTSPEPLDSGDEFKLGETILRFEIAVRKGSLKKAAAKEVDAQAVGKPAAPSVSLLSRLGLGSPVRLAGVGVLVVALAALMLWPTPERLPPQTPEQRLPINYDNSIGYLDVDRAHLDKAIFQFPTNSEGIMVSFRLLAPSGVDVAAGSRAVAKIEAAKDWRGYELLAIPKALASGPRGDLTFDNLGYGPSDGDIEPSKVVPWGVQKMWLMQMPVVGSTQGQLLDAIKALRDLFDRMTDNPGNRFQLIAGLRNASIGLMKLSGRSTVLVEIPSTTVETRKISSALDTAIVELDGGHADRSLTAATSALALEEAELDREFRSQMNSLALARKSRKAVDEGQVLAVLTRLIPDPVDPRNRNVRTMVRKLSSKSRESYDETMRDLTR